MSGSMIIPSFLRSFATDAIRSGRCHSLPSPTFGRQRFVGSRRDASRTATGIDRLAPSLVEGLRANHSSSPTPGWCPSSSGCSSRSGPYTNSRTLDEETLHDVVQRVVELAQADKIILFGSAARGEMVLDSDIDLLVIKDAQDSLALAAQIHRGIRSVRTSVDAIVVAPAHVERQRDSKALVIKSALREGSAVYEASQRTPAQ